MESIFTGYIKHFKVGIVDDKTPLYFGIHTKDMGGGQKFCFFCITKFSKSLFVNTIDDSVYRCGYDYVSEKATRVKSYFHIKDNNFNEAVEILKKIERIKLFDKELRKCEKIILIEAI